MQNHAHFAQCMHVWPFTATPVGALALIYERGQRVNIKDSRSNWWITASAAAGRGQMSQPRVALARPATGPASAAGHGLDLELSPKKI